MSAYGEIVKPVSSTSQLASTIWRTNYPNKSLTIHHLTIATALLVPGLTDYLHSVFTAVLEDGQTYPMEIADANIYTRESFEGYFFSADVLIAIKSPFEERPDGSEVVVSVDEARASRSWSECVAGFYYVRVHDTPCYMLILNP